MHDEDICEWHIIGERLAELEPEKFQRILLHLREIIDAQEIISQETPQETDHLLDARQEMTNELDLN